MNINCCFHTLLVGRSLIKYVGSSDSKVAVCFIEPDISSESSFC